MFACVNFCRISVFVLRKLLPPAYVVRREGNVFIGVCPFTVGEGAPGVVPPPSQVKGAPRVPHPPARSGWGVPGVPFWARSGGAPSPPPRDESRESTCYAASGKPLAFMQEDFLVRQCNHRHCCYHCQLHMYQVLCNTAGTGRGVVEAQVSAP